MVGSSLFDFQCGLWGAQTRAGPCDVSIMHCASSAVHRKVWFVYFAAEGACVHFDQPIRSQICRAASKMARGRKRTRAAGQKKAETAGLEESTHMETVAEVSGEGESNDTSKVQSGAPAVPAPNGNIPPEEANHDGSPTHMAGSGDACSTGESEIVWTAYREDKLIDMFRDCTFLYDKKVPAFQERHKKDKAIERFAKVLGVTRKYG